MELFENSHNHNGEKFWFFIGQNFTPMFFCHTDQMQYAIKAIFDDMAIKVDLMGIYGIVGQWTKTLELREVLEVILAKLWLINNFLRNSVQ